jgi:hypothetical protein
VEWQDFITICKEINYTANASKKARMVIQKQLKEYKEPQTQFLTLSVSISFSVSKSIGIFLF